MPEYRDPDESWSFPLNESQAIPPSRVRHDPRFEFQIYSQSFTQTEPGEVLVTVAQAVASDDGNSVTMHTFLKKSIPTSELRTKLAIFTQICIDEVGCKLYLTFRGATRNRRGGKSFRLFVLDISFGPPDKFGHRRVAVTKGETKLTINFGKIIGNCPIFFLHPKTGHLLFHVYDGRFDNLMQMNGVLELKKSRGSIVDATRLGTVSHLFTYANINGHRFSQNGKRLVVFSPSLSSILGTDDTCRLSVVQWYSTDGEFRLERTLNFDSLAFIRKLYPAAVFAINCKLLKRADSLNEKTMFRGHSLKYSFISCHGGVAAVKNFDRWITNEQLNKTRYIFLFFNHCDLFKASPLQRVERMSFVLDTRLYYVVTDREKTEQRLNRVDLGDQFKDYRTCAHCGAKEIGKRRNAEGKRIAQFKVCRECKKLKLHHQWWKYSCHFCSEYCMKKGWKKHKKLHKPYYQRPFLWILVAVVMLLLWIFFMT